MEEVGSQNVKLRNKTKNQKKQEIQNDQSSEKLAIQGKQSAEFIKNGSKSSQNILENQVETSNETKNIEAMKSTKDSRGNTKVIVRFRPQNELEKEIPIEQDFELKFPTEDSVTIIDNKIPSQFSFDKVFPMDTSQQKVFDTFGEKLIQDIIEGYNGTIFAYGQTGSGKTYSMMGADIYDSIQKGIIPRVAQRIFEKIEETELEIQFILKCSMLEIYRENLRDLFDPDIADLKIKESPQRGIYVEGLSEESVISQEEIYAFLELGNSNRIVASTGMNKQSSRSHSIFFLEVQQKFSNGNERRGQLNLVDLAGSEKIKKTHVSGDNLEEAKKINLSLSALGNVIHALTTNSDHIPYRDSKLTRLLQSSLGGNFQTTLLIACSPHPRNLEETLNTLKFAQRAKFVKNKPKQNIKRGAQYYLSIIAELKKELEECQAQLQNYESQSSINQSKTESIFPMGEQEKPANSFKQPAFLKKMSWFAQIEEEQLEEYKQPLNWFKEQTDLEKLQQKLETLELKYNELKVEHQQNLELNNEYQDEILSLKDQLDKQKIHNLEVKQSQLELLECKEQASFQIKKLTDEVNQLTKSQELLKQQIQTLNQLIQTQEVEIKKLITIQKRSQMLHDQEINQISKDQENQLNDSLLQDKDIKDIQQKIQDSESNEELKIYCFQQLQSAALKNSLLEYQLITCEWKQELEVQKSSIKNLEIQFLQEEIEMLKNQTQNQVNQNRSVQKEIDHLKNDCLERQKVYQFQRNTVRQKSKIVRSIGKHDLINKIQFMVKNQQQDNQELQIFPFIQKNQQIQQNQQNQQNKQGLLSQFLLFQAKQVVKPQVSIDNFPKDLRLDWQKIKMNLSEQDAGIQKSLNQELQKQLQSNLSKYTYQVNRQNQFFMQQLEQQKENLLHSLQRKQKLISKLYKIQSQQVEDQMLQKKHLLQENKSIRNSKSADEGFIMEYIALQNLSFLGGRNSENEVQQQKKKFEEETLFTVNELQVAEKNQRDKWSRKACKSPI